MCHGTTVETHIDNRRDACPLPSTAKDKKKEKKEYRVIE
jgi:hypothetical protein